jgi:hypothetical protein
VSSILYGRIVGTKAGLRQAATGAAAESPPTIRARAADETGGLLEKLAALFPAELLLAYSILGGLVSSTTEDSAHKDASTITDPDNMRWVLLGLVVFAFVFYAAGRLSTPTPWNRRDWLRMLIPAAAVAAWLGLQHPNPWVVFGYGGQTTLTILAVFLALLAIALSIAFPAKATP